jgi:hypothetical protein
MIETVLMVTLLWHNQPPVNYQSTFNSHEACENARLSLIAERDRMMAEAQRKAEQQYGRGAMVIGAAPQILAVCVAK